MEYWKNLDLEELDGEVFVPTYERNTYYVSNFGRIRSLYRKTVNRSIRERILKQNVCEWGYCTTTFSVGRRRNKVVTHKIVALAFLPNPENKPHVNHINGIKTDNRVENLEWCTHSENMQHAYDTGLNKNHGLNHNKNKLTLEQVLLIKRYYMIYKKKNYKAVSVKFNVSNTTIRRIATGKMWNHI